MTTAPTATAEERLAELTAAQELAEKLFSVITERGMVRPGVTELELSNEIKELASAEFGISRYWHKRVVRAGVNTLCPYDENPPDLAIGLDDIVFLDFGPIFAEWEADFGRTFVLGDDPAKLKLKADAEGAWAAAKAYFDATPDCTGAMLWDFVQAEASSRGWEFGGTIAGHIVGEFPHEKLDEDEVECYVVPANQTPMRGLDPYGRPRHWICEMHLVDKAAGIGAFHEQLVTVR